MDNTDRITGILVQNLQSAIRDSERYSIACIVLTGFAFSVAVTHSSEPVRVMGIGIKFPNEWMISGSLLVAFLLSFQLMQILSRAAYLAYFFVHPSGGGYEKYIDQMLAHSVLMAPSVFTSTEHWIRRLLLFAPSVLTALAIFYSSGSEWWNAISIQSFPYLLVLYLGWQPLGVRPPSAMGSPPRLWD